MWKTISAIIMLLITLYFASGCSSQGYEFDPNEYTFPDEFNTQVYEVYHEDENDGYEMTRYEYTPDYLTDAEQQAIFESWRIAREEQDKYDTYAETWDKDSFYVGEKKRIENLCEEEGFFGCYDIKYICEDEHDCRRVFSECEEGDFDPTKLVYPDYDNHNKRYDCDQWDVDIEDNEFDIRHVDEEFLEEGGYQWD